MSGKEISEELERTSNYIIEKNISDKEMEIKRVFYPIPPHGNNVTTYITLDIEGKSLSYIVVNNNWNGTGVSQSEYVELDDDEVEVLKEQFKGLKTLRDFEKLEGTMIKMRDERNKEIESVVGELVEAIDELYISDAQLRRAKELLKDKEQLKEIIMEELDSYTTEY